MIIKALYSVTEVASMLGVHRDSVLAMIRRGDLDGVQLGRMRQWYIPIASLQSTPLVWESILQAAAINSAHDESKMKW